MLSPKAKCDFVDLVKYAKLDMTLKTRIDVDQCIFTNDIARVYHILLKAFFKIIIDSLDALRKMIRVASRPEAESEKTKFKKQFSSLYRNLIVFNVAINNCNVIMKLYTNAIKILPSLPSTPTHPRLRKETPRKTSPASGHKEGEEDNDEDGDDDEEGDDEDGDESDPCTEETWQDSY